MAEQTYTDVRRVYDLRKLDESYYPIIKSEKGFWGFCKSLWSDQLAEPRLGDLSQPRLLLTKKIIRSIGESLDKKVELAGVNQDELPEILGEKLKPYRRGGEIKFYLVDEGNKTLGSIDYSIGIRRTDIYGPETDVGGGMEAVVFGSAIENASQFNALQQKI